LRVICTLFACVLFCRISSAAQPVPASALEAETTSEFTLGQVPTGGMELLSDTQGVDFSSWLKSWHKITQQAWDPLFSAEANAPKSKSGIVAIRFKVLPNGRLMDRSMVLEGRSGDVALDRAAWGALTGLRYPPLPSHFHGPYLELRAYFPYKTQPGQ
jgi:outer membrane biosynthesis protein TonB